MKGSQTVVRLIGALLRLYPRGYRRTFGAERQLVLEEAFSAAAEEGKWAVAGLAWRECCDLPGSIFWAYRHEWEDNMTGSGTTIPEGKMRWLGIVPFVLLGVAMLLLEFPGTYIQPNSIMAVLVMVFFLGGYLAILGGLLAGMLAGFPSWSFPYLLYGLMFAFYLSFAATPGLVIFNVEMWGKGMWGWRAWVPVGAVILLGLLLSRPVWKPLVSLGKGIWSDASRLSFGLYGLFPFLMVLVMDEVNNTFGFPYLLTAELLLVVGAGLYLATRATWVRAAALGVTAFLAVLAAQFGSQFFWSTHSVNLTTGTIAPLEGPVPWGQIWSESWMPALIFTLVMLSPLLLGILRRAIAWVRHFSNLPTPG